jgi:hypothetical protein
MPSTAMSIGAVEAAVAVARRQGLPVRAPVLLRDRSNVLVHLRPAPGSARSGVTGRDERARAG